MQNPLESPPEYDGQVYQLVSRWFHVISFAARRYVKRTYIFVDFVKHFEHMYKFFSLTLCADKCLLQVGSLQLLQMLPSDNSMANFILHI